MNVYHQIQHILVVPIVMMACRKNRGNIKVTNIVLQSQLNTNIDLDKLAKSLYNIIYKPSNFSAAIFRSRKCKGSCLIFNNGKLITSGTNNLNDAVKNCRKYMRIIQKKCLKGDIVKTPTVITISAVCDVGFKIDLKALYKSLNGRASLETEIFGALFYKNIKLKCHLSIFQSGKITITGAKTVKQINHCYRTLKKELRPYMRY